MTRSRRFFASSPWIATGTADYVNLGYTSRGLAKQALMRLSRKSLAIFRKLGLGRAFDMPFISYSTTVRIPQYHVCQFPALDPTLERASLIRKPPEAQSDYWFPTLRSRSHSYIANILCSIRSHAGKKMILLGFPTTVF